MILDVSTRGDDVLRNKTSHLESDSSGAQTWFGFVVEAEAEAFWLCCF